LFSIAEIAKEREQVMKLQMFVPRISNTKELTLQDMDLVNPTFLIPTGISKTEFKRAITASAKEQGCIVEGTPEFEELVVKLSKAIAGY